MLNTFDLVFDPFDNWQQVNVDKEYPVFGVIDYVNQLIGKKAKVDSMKNPSDKGKAPEIVWRKAMGLKQESNAIGCQAAGNTQFGRCICDTG